jgi:hypothetical protein
MVGARRHLEWLILKGAAGVDLLAQECIDLIVDHPCVPAPATLPCCDLHLLLLLFFLIYAATDDALIVY